MLNLLPPQKKEELRLDFLNQIVISIAIAIIFMVLLLAPLFLIAQGFLNVNLDRIEGELSFWRAKAEIKELENLEKKVRELNRNLVFLDARQKEQVRFSLFLESLAKSAPSGIRFDDISVKESNVSIRGYALTRDILLVFKSNLEQVSYVSNFNFPLSNLTKATDINFSLSFSYGL